MVRTEKQLAVLLLAHYGHHWLSMLNRANLVTRYFLKTPANVLLLLKVILKRQEHVSCPSHQPHRQPIQLNQQHFRRDVLFHNGHPILNKCIGPKGVSAIVQILHPIILMNDWHPYWWLQIHTWIPLVCTFRLMTNLMLVLNATPAQEMMDKNYSHEPEELANLISLNEYLIALV